MKRRDFLKQSVFASGMALIPSFLKGMEFLSPDQLSGYKNVIIIQLSGGNDGLNTIIPISNDIYHSLRPSIAKKSGQTLKITEDLAFNNNLKEIAALYNQGEVSIINNVGYPNPNRSHFRSTDIWQTASDTNQYLHTGWVGRYLDANCHHPYQAIEVDNSLSLAMKGRTMNGIAVSDPNQLYRTTREPFFNNIITNTQKEMLDEENQGYLYKTMLETYSSASYIYETSKIYKTSTTYPQTPFAKNLKIIADFIVSGLKTKVFYSSLGGFDSHVNQLNTQDRLLNIYSEAIGALVLDLKKNDRFNDTLILTFSEFGRRVKQNGSRGTDHGAANNVLAISGALKKAGVYNELPNLSDLDNNGDIKYSVDFRSVYATILNNWLNVDDQAILNTNFKNLGFI
ncbi:DUF1501 domain-containing protein [Aquimarina sp. 2201CG5-10]|uniref:DUF1501 domain-containing protein n=1 Tax=Aquimarina callyspongiae TaxID=3098150 RepID=UPI002AB54C99|nr:DUF1501 domain-containing protein [Aquimarina sp. 2201CG5-10]MDY8134221.1 DUF1501 domain-containing protein [Aquimarina sp. 2201CG5-10]